MNLWNRIKYELLRWLLDDICEKSECGSCEIDRAREGNIICFCYGYEVFVQARKVWKLEQEA